MSNNKKKLIVKAIIAVIICIATFIIVRNCTENGINYVSYTADKCRTIYDSAETIEVEEGDEIGAIIYAHYVYLFPGKYTITISGSSDSDKNTYDLYTETKDKVLLDGEYEPGKKISYVAKKAIKDLEIRVFYGGENDASVSSVKITRKITAAESNIISIVIIFILALVYLLIRFKRNVVVRIFSGVIGIPVFTLWQMLFIEALYNNESMFYEFLAWFKVGMRDRYICNSYLAFLLIINVAILCIFRYASIFIPVSTILSGIFALVGYNFYVIRGEAFTFSQLILANEATQVVGDYEVYIPFLFWIGVIASFVLALVFLKIKITNKWYIQIIGFSVAAIAFSINLSMFDSYIEEDGGATVMFIVQDYYEENGFFTGTLVTRDKGIDVPDLYSAKTVNSIIEDCAAEEYEGDELPTIIYIQCESLYDLSKLTDADWNENPLLYLDELSEECYVGNLISPMAGGGTCNVEFEMLTGYWYYNTSGTPFINQIEEDEDSIVSILNNLGYDTVAIHTNTGSFFNRRTAYSNLGFSRVLFEEELGETPEERMIGSWADDRYAYDCLIEDYEQRDASKPYFAHVVTTQNHGGYNYEYDVNGITVSGDISELENRQKQTYLNLSKESMNSLEYLLSYFSSVDDDVIIVFWGDHCPSLSYFGITVDSVEDTVLEYETPLVVWNNYGADLEFDDVISAYNVTPQLLSQLGIETDTYMNYASSNDVAKIVSGAIVVGDTITGIDELSDEQQTILENLWILQYDRMYGKKYSSETDN